MLLVGYYKNWCYKYLGIVYIRLIFLYLTFNKIYVDYASKSRRI